MNTINAQRQEKNARVHLFARPVHFATWPARQHAETARLNAALAKNLEELGVG
ncbi:MAG: hypothetical protein SNJ67_13380 [Chloracidobacterium sp.]|uniref:Uncharacterized protein n=1 Tax=Chloracidobacterium validum TaxID=2821543 RepID=A0ABX8BHG6_9BACT|nr:hypothetical protein [Chloracidobacterium validum]QUW04530.1 hypothetical protein J8C06_12145 [Chloracidobacterium validum]